MIEIYATIETKPEGICIEAEIDDGTITTQISHTVSLKPAPDVLANRLIDVLKRAPISPEIHEAMGILLEAAR